MFSHMLLCLLTIVVTAAAAALHLIACTQGCAAGVTPEAVNITISQGTRAHAVQVAMKSSVLSLAVVAVLLGMSVEGAGVQASVRRVAAALIIGIHVHLDLLLVGYDHAVKL
jgi:P pilus assembly chaperone PapD